MTSLHETFTNLGKFLLTFAERGNNVEAKIAVVKSCLVTATGVGRPLLSL